ncbi:RNA polymerase sigma-70 factor [Proteiniphilum sp. X52]|uniref:RNA polymerase sigma-70 factor n=1 Tax=Proteiniphilum sp. X52 TaxID=2382159 RepID=UPI00210187A7|nr:RNA polymerase sigma-70 factor [Proteiniphilum sp. X52]
MNENKLKLYEDIFIKYFPKVKCFITRFIKSSAIAEELTQDVFVKIWENFDKIMYIEYRDAYIYRIARNAALDYITQKYKEESLIDNVKLREGYSIEEEMDAKELELLIELTVNGMPPQRKKVYEMSRIDGLTNDEIAKNLNISKKTVENHLNLALKRIKKIITAFPFLFVIIASHLQ